MVTPATKINRSDLQAYPSERLTDNDDGGGMPLGIPLTGAPNELFDPIPAIVRTNGGFFVRLMYMGVQRADDEPLLGAFAAITKPPFDPNVSYLFCPVSNYGELRAQSLKRIQAFNVASIESRMTLLSTQSQNSKIIQAYQTVGEPLPLVGDVYCLRQDDPTYPEIEQYVQVSRVQSEERRFTEQSSGGAEFTVTVIKMEISKKLDFDFIGIDYPVKGYANAPCKMRETSVADAAQYYGVKPIVEPILADRQTIKVASLMEKIVPTNQIETFLTNLNASGQRQSLFDSAKTGTDGIVTLDTAKSHEAGTTTSIYLGNAATPNTVVIETSSGQITDKGGQLIFNSLPVGTISYSTGQITINATTYTDYIISVSFRPAGSEQQVADTAREDVTINNRGYSWGINITPSPSVGSLTVSFRSQARWYELRDDGTGVLRGASEAHGSGNVNYATGSVTVTCGELPDVGSAILYSWGTRARYFNRSGTTASAKMILQLKQNADPSSISLAWNDGTAKTATSDAAGNITGDWTGKFDMQSNQIRIDTGANFNHPAGVLDVAVSYSAGEKTAMTFNAPVRDGAGKVTLTLGDIPLKPNTVRLKYNLAVEDLENQSYNQWSGLTKTLTDDGAGKLVDSTGANVGTINYSTRVAAFTPATTVQVPKRNYTTETYDGMGGDGLIVKFSRQVFSGFTQVSANATLPLDASALVEVWFYDTSPTSTITEQLTSGSIEIDMLPNFAEVVMPASLNFSWGGGIYFDKNGLIYTNLNALTGIADPAGTINYAAGTVLLTNWHWIDGAAPSIKALATSISGNPVDAVTFRTPSAPIRAGSLDLRATALDGTVLSAKAKLNGSIESAGITGFIDVEHGVADVRFGSFVTAAGNELEPWYNADAVTPDGKIWRSKHVFANTITYDARASSYLPVNTDVIKVDTVRLPQDGRVPIFRRGDTVLIGNRLTDNIGSAHSGGQTVQLSRTGLTRICVTDADDKPVNAELWDYDLATGTITWKTPLDLSPYKMPLQVMHAHEERNVITDTDIDGTLSLRFATSRAYPVADTYVSSVLIGGNLQVRVSIPFTQRTWNDVWSDEPVDTQLLNKLNIRDYPMLLTDDGAIKERWMIKMTGTAQFELYGETLGFVMRGDTLTDLKPLNPASGKPYFTLPKQAFGNQAPWASQDIIRFNTWGTLMPVLVICAVQPNANDPVGEDGFDYCLYGDTTEMNV